MDGMTTEMFGTATNTNPATVFDANDPAPFALENAPLWMRSLPPGLVNRAPTRWDVVASARRLHNTTAQSAAAPAPLPKER
jgi:hypothetical protein